MSGSFLIDPVVDKRFERLGDREVSEARIGISVACESGYDGEETPCCFYICSRRRQVAEVLDRWLAGDYRNFKVKSDDGGLYILRHTMTTDLWELTLYAGGEC